MMTWEQKIQACQALEDFSLRMRSPGDWYVDHRGVDVSDGVLMEGGCVIDAPTPEKAVEAHWKWLTELPPGSTVVVKGVGYKWNGFMWRPNA